MSVSFGLLVAALWLGWLAYWTIAASGVKATARAEGWQSRLAYSAPLWVAAVLLLSRNWPWPLDEQIYPVGNLVAFVGLLVAAAGFAVAVWARLALGANWSAEVTVKEEHELIRTGPYAFVRHPIYTGLSLAFLGTAIVVGEWRAFAALAIAVASFWYKLRIEERVMRETFGDAYDAYVRQVKALVPFLI